VDSEQFEAFMATLNGMAEEWDTTNRWLREMVGLLEPIKMYLEMIEDRVGRIVQQS
jgi:hypothetical protein